MMLFSLNTLPISVNQAYGVANGRKFLTTKAREWKEAAIFSFQEQIKHQNIHGNDYNFQIYSMESAELCLIITLQGNWHTKTGKIRIKDGDNYLKLLKDALFEAFKTVNPSLNDCQSFMDIIKKEDSDTEGVMVRIGTLEELAHLIKKSNVEIKLED